MSNMSATCHICGNDTEHDPGTGYDPICECSSKLRRYRDALMRIEQLNIEAHREAVNIACTALHLS